MSGKMLIVLLAVCLVSAHAFVKRDVPQGETNYVDNIQKQFQDLTKDLNQKLGDAFNPDNIKKGFNEALDNLQKALNDLKEKANTPK